MAGLSEFLNRNYVTPLKERVEKKNQKLTPLKTSDPE
jgi:hypothetical protein